MWSSICRILTRNAIYRSVYGYSETSRLMCHVAKGTDFVSCVTSSQFKNIYLGELVVKHSLSAKLSLPTNSRLVNFPSIRPVFPIDILDTVTEKDIREPSSGKDELQAARLIVIRRRKMKKHKLKKLRKKMKYEWAKVRQRRELRKEKAFQAKLVAQIKEGEQFDPAKYIADKLQRVQEYEESQQKPKIKKIIWKKY